MIGTKLAHYEITNHLGSGGMGDVYQATDLKLGRSVAIKFLSEAFTHDSERVARFEREARVLASLNHPNIAALHGLEESNDRKFLVMELVDGETLAERIRRGSIPVHQSLGIAKQICEALEAAHEKGIIHRDLKPANVKITSDGHVKVLDFGLAKAMESSPANPQLSNSPTLSLVATNAGVVLGTASYMSPEQAKGRAVDRRADIFAFGCVLYEMLTGQPPFDGNDVTEILGRVVTADVDWSRLPPATPAAIHRLLQRALKKDPKQRLGDIRDAKLELEDAGTEPRIAAASTSTRSPRMAWIALAVAAAITIALTIPVTHHLRESPPEEIHLEINTPSTEAPTSFALSPDGRSIVFVASGDGPQRLWLRTLSKTEAQPLAGTDGADLPFWSPDGRSIGFFATNKLYRLDLGGGLPKVLANAASGRGGTWNPDGIIVFSPGVADPLMRISASGGDAVAITHLDIPRQYSHRLPQFLPDAQHFLYYAQGTADAAGIYLASLKGDEPKRLSAADSQCAFLKPDLIAFIQQGVLLARHLNITRGEMTGDPIVLAESVGSDFLGLGAFSISNDVIAYRSATAGRTQLRWMDRDGKTLGVVGDATISFFPELSPDGRHVAISRPVQGNMDIWLLDIVRGNLTPFTFDPGSDSFSIWSPDGKWIVFTSNRKGSYDLYLKPSSGTVTEEALLTGPYRKIPQDWSEDGRFLLYYEINPKTGRDLKVLEMNGKERTSRVVTNTPFDETIAEFSPDLRWVAYQTDEARRFEIVVQPFPEATAKWQVSTNGGMQPRWRPDGKELYFIAPDGKLMAVPIMATSGSFAAGKPLPLFQLQLVSSISASISRPQYAVSRDGRFLVNQPLNESTPSPSTVILNWRPR